MTPPPSSQKIVLLLDLSGDKHSAHAWAAREFSEAEIRVINKADLKWGSKREALRLIRSVAPDLFAFFTSDLEMQSARSAMLLFAALSGARRVVMADRFGRTLTRSRLGALLIEAPRFALELLAYVLIVPLSWFLTLLLGGSLFFRKINRASRTGSPESSAQSGKGKTALYVRATITNTTEGGMATHVAGFRRGALKSGHHLKYLISGRGHGADETVLIAPSSAVSATRALFELWNNLVFTFKSLELLSDQIAVKDIDFIYQRYNRFNWAGVALSVVTGLPLALEFNGSEVWVSRRWDPVGQIWLLKRFERLNLRAADFIFVVSDVERHNLLGAGVEDERIRVNPNGVDTDEFKPDSGGRQVRRSLGVDDKIVIGFLGTFGPWHGAPVLAEAATKVDERTGCHFLFIGDGDQRPVAEAIIEKADKRDRATFTGRIAHAEVPAYLDACDILASPHVESTDGSEFFGSPTKLFEYLAMARPVVASRIGQIADVIEDGKTGVLVEPGNAAALAQAIERLAKDADLRSRLGVAARQMVSERFTWKRNADRVFTTVMRGMTRDA